MYRQGVRFTTGWVNAQAMMPRVIDLLRRKRPPLEKIHTVVPWSEAIEALKDPPHKLVIVRDNLLPAAMRPAVSPRQ
jgi:hypothetical protein